MTRQERQEKLFRAIGYVGDDLIQRADAPAQAERKQPAVWIKWAALAACCALVIGLASRLPLFGAKTSNTAPPKKPFSSANTRSSVFTKLPRPTITSSAPFFIEHSRVRVRKPSVSGVDGRQLTTMSACGKSSSALSMV